MEKIKIIGAGISGIAAGCYLQMKGYDTEIFEKHSIPGGLCTSWYRDGYRFDGCIHWLLGSDKGSVFHNLWSELMDMKDIEFVNHTERVCIEVKENTDKYGSKLFHLYTNLEELEKYLLDLSPSDEKPIHEFLGSIQYLQKFNLPPLADKAPAERTVMDQLKLIKYIPLLQYLKRWNKVSNFSFAQRFQNPFLKEAFELLFEGKEYSMLIMTFQLAYFSVGCAGYPVGGSYDFVKHLEDRYCKLGGKISYNTGIKKILTKENKAVGLETIENQIIDADIVISAADWNFTIFKALEGRYTNRIIQDLKEEKVLEVFESVFLVSIGVNGTFDHVPHLLRFPLAESIKAEDGSEFNRMEAHVFNYDRTMAPAGKTTISVTLTAQQPEYWIELRKNNYGKYKAVKEKLAKEVIDRLEHRIGHVKGYVEVIDVATPATFYRYTGNWKGSIQGWMPSKRLFSASPVKSTLPGLKNFYMTGHWMEPGGGLPMALMTGRNIAGRVCGKNK